MNNNNRILDFERIPDNLLISATRLRDIRKASLMPYKTRKPGEPDILIRTLGFPEEHITRHALIHEYMYCNGENIKLGAWRENKEVLVMHRGEPIRVYVIYIPTRFKVRVNGRVPRYPNGYYIICKGSTNGLDREHPLVLDARFFKKMYRLDGNIEQQLRDLRSRKNNNGIKEDIGFGISKRVENEPHKIDIPNIDEDASTFDISNERSKNVKQTTSKVDSIYSKNVGGETEKKFTAVGKHVTNGVVDGLFIKNKETGIVK